MPSVKLTPAQRSAPLSAKRSASDFWSAGEHVDRVVRAGAEGRHRGGGLRQAPQHQRRVERDRVEGVGREADHLAIGGACRDDGHAGGEHAQRGAELVRREARRLGLAGRVHRRCLHEFSCIMARNRKTMLQANPGARLGRCLRSRAGALRAAARRHGGHPQRKPEPAGAAASWRGWRRHGWAARPSDLTVPTVFEAGGPAVRSTGASTALQQIAPVVAALAGSTLVVDCTVEGLMHAPELPAILRGGARVIYVSNEHPEALARLRARRCARAAGQGARETPAFGAKHARHVGRRHRPRHFAWPAPRAAATGATPPVPAP